MASYPISTYVVGLQGAFGIFNGLYNLTSRKGATASMELLGISSLPAIHSIALGSLSIGAFYIRSAFLRDRPMLWALLPGRALAVFIFWPHGGAWKNVAIFEGVCGLLTGLSLLWEELRGVSKEKAS